MSVHSAHFDCCLSVHRRCTMSMTKRIMRIGTDYENRIKIYVDGFWTTISHFLLKSKKKYDFLISNEIQTHTNMTRDIWKTFEIIRTEPRIKIITANGAVVIRVGCCQEPCCSHRCMRWEHGGPMQCHEHRRVIINPPKCYKLTDWLQ